MRRSGAPSSLPTSKRPRFLTPFSGNRGQENLDSIQAPPKSADSGVSQSRLQEVLSKIHKPTLVAVQASLPTSLSAKPVGDLSGCSGGHSLLVSGQAEPVRRDGFAGGITAVPEDCVSCQSASGNGSSESNNGCGQRYYNVMWCKRSKKKHKTWEGDAVLIVKGNGVNLKDMDGKGIGKGLGYKRSELSGLEDGSTLVIGGKEIEVMGELKAEDFKSGKCFTGLDTDDTSNTVNSVPKAVVKKRFIPFTNSLINKEQISSAPLKPMFDPATPAALVMPHPGPRHQLEQNPKGLPVTDVVVDPHLSTSLRPHQREGVVFLYQCLMGMRDFVGQGAILADEMGLGKTLQCITLIWTLLKQGPYGLRPVLKKILIITPGSLVKNWEREFHKWLGSERLKVYSVSGDSKTEGFVKSPLHPVLIISYEMFLRAQEVLRVVNFDLVICDEGHRLKNAGAKTTSVIAHPSSPLLLLSLLSLPAFPPSFPRHPSSLHSFIHSFPPPLRPALPSSSAPQLLTHSQVISSLPTRKRVLLTGTPIQNDLQEFYSIVDFCNPSILGSHGAFLKVYEGPILLSRQQSATSEEREMGQARAEELKRLISLFCLRRTQDIINKYLPPKVENVVFCRMSELQLSLYKQLLNSHLVRACFHSTSHHGDTSFPPHLLCIGALRKLCNSPSLVHAAALLAAEGRQEEEGEKDGELLYSGVLKLFPGDYDPRERSVAENGCGKLAVLSKMLCQLFSTTKEKVVIVSNYTQMLDVLEGFCHRRGYRFLRLDGSTPTSKRQGIVERFNSKHGREAVFLLSSKAGGVGLNLIGASRLVLYDLDWNPANDLQAMARVWRDGQKRKVHIYRLLTTGSIEEKIFQRQICKLGLNTVLDFDGCGNEGSGCGSIAGLRKEGEGKWEAKFTREELKNLFSLREDTLCDTHDLVQCGCGGGHGLASSGCCSMDDASICADTNVKDSGLLDSGVNKLLQWDHYSHPLQQTSLSDDLLVGGASSMITFVLQTKTEVT